MKCPKCGKPLREQKKFQGLWTCCDVKCNGMHLTKHGGRAFEAALIKAHKEKDQQSHSE